MQEILFPVINYQRNSNDKYTEKIFSKRMIEV